VVLVLTWLTFPLFARADNIEVESAGEGLSHVISQCHLLIAETKGGANVTSRMSYCLGYIQLN
jgi:hypothetical protein